MRGRGREAVDLRQMLLARQHQLGRGERIGQLPLLFGDLARIDADEEDREQDREPDAEQIIVREIRAVGVGPRQRIMEENQQGRAQHRERAEHHGHARRQGGRREQHRPQEKERERIFQPAGEEHQDRELRDIEGQQPGGAVGLDAARVPEADAQRDIEPGRQRDDGEAGPDRQIEFEAEIDHQHRGGLADHRQPAQPHQRVEAHVAARLFETIAFGHPGYFILLNAGVT